MQLVGSAHYNQSHMVLGDSPASCVTPEILALAFQEASSYFLASIVIPAGVVDEIGRADLDVRIDELVILLHEGGPFMILRHSDRTNTEFLDSGVGGIGFPLKDTCVGIIRLLYLADNDRLQFATGIFKV